MKDVHLQIGDSYRMGIFDNKPIEWLVVGVKDNLALIVTKEILAPMSFCTQKRGIFSSLKLNNYKESDIRKYLNDDFYKNTFNEFEKKAIIETTIDNSAEAFGKGKNKYACENTKDKVFLLSAKEVSEGFKDRTSRIAKGTDFAIKKRLFVDHGYSIWWLRSPSPYNSGHVICVEHDGDLQPYPINKHGNTPYGEQIGIRPAVWIDPNLYRKYKEEAELMKALTPKDKAKYRNVNLPKDEKGIELKKAKVGVTVEFGTYGNSKITWKVLEIKDNKALLVSSRILEYLIFDEYNAVFSSSGIHNWLNQNFYERSFTDDEKKKILKTTVKNHEEFDNDSLDNVFLLSKEESLKYFPTPIDLAAYPTFDCVHKGIKTNISLATCDWYLRTPEVRSKIYVVNDAGEITPAYPNDGAGIRPAMWVEIK